MEEGLQKSHVLWLLLRLPKRLVKLDEQIHFFTYVRVLFHTHLSTCGFYSRIIHLSTYE